MQTGSANTNAATCDNTLIHEAQLVRSYARYVAFVGLRLLSNRANVVDLVQLVLRALARSRAGQTDPT